jgi:hypothetical protein
MEEHYMATESRLDGQHLHRRWVLATFGGWLLGIVAVILLGGISEGIHFGDQFPVGIGMGWGVGFAQWRVARKWFGVTSAWMWVSAAALGMPFVLSDITVLSWAGNEQRYFLILNVALGASLLGLLEWRILRSRSNRAYWWIITCIVGWMLPSLVIFLPTGGHPETLLAMIFNFCVIASGGVVLGVVSGAMLVWILRSRPTAA